MLLKFKCLPKEVHRLSGVLAEPRRTHQPGPRFISLLTCVCVCVDHLPFAKISSNPWGLVLGVGVGCRLSLGAAEVSARCS